MWVLHDRLKADTFFVSDLPLCSVLLMNNQLFPWLILVPRLAEVREIIDVSPADQHRLMDEIASALHIMRKLFTPDKLNVAALGNQVPQLHIHVIARFANDAAWPNPVWGNAVQPYQDSASVVERIKLAFGNHP